MLNFADIAVVRPTREGLAARYAAIHQGLDQTSEGARAAALGDWDALRREVESWQSMVRLRFDQDTTDPQYKEDRDYADALMPEAMALEVALKRRLLEEPDRDTLIDEVGAHAVRLWETDVTTFNPAIKADLEREAKISARYTELLASAKIEIDDKIVNLAGLGPYAQSLDRSVRHQAATLRWAFFEANAPALDEIYDELVKLRHGMAEKLGYSSFTALGYRRMRRVDYGPEDVARYRDQVVEHVVPLVQRIMAAKAARFGYDAVRAWDEPIDDPAGNPGPAGDHDFLVGAAQSLFDDIDSRLAAFYSVMRKGDFLDLKNRPSKAGGGFCTSFPAVGVPYIFANFNGTDHDVTVFTHEMGHAFQNWQSRHLPVIDYLWPTSESAEINSMGLEVLTYPGIGRLVGDDAAERFRQTHMLGVLRFLPYGVCVDHFQHEVYENPTATPAERHAMWKKLERRYMPWRDYGDLAYPAKGAFWQSQLHVYLYPFYYIDYTLAQCCALQIWVKSRQDYAASFEQYLGLCNRGGSAPFQTLVRDAGLVSPFAAGALSDVVTEAAKFLGL